MSSATPAPESGVKPPYPTRFGWGIRLLLCFLIFDMLWRGFSVCYPWGEWAGELDMRKRPRRLPTRAEIAEMAREASDTNPTPVRDEVFKALDSVWTFFKPWPDAEVSSRLHTWQDTGKWAMVWTTSRLEFIENVFGYNEEWPMFSPSVGKKKWLARARLVFADGSERIVRSKGDPEDLTNYSHWFEEKILDHELKVKEGERYESDVIGYCNLLLHRHGRNDRGAELKKIYFFVVRYDLPPPGVDIRKWWKEQTGPPADQVYKEFYEYDVATRKGTILVESYD